MDKSNDPDFGSDIGANMDNDEKDTENDSHSEIIDFDDRAAEDKVDGNSSKKNKRQSSEAVFASGKKKYPCKTWQEWLPFKT